MEKTHWKKYTNPDYLGAYAFQPGEEKTVTIKEVKRELVFNPSGSGKEECTVAFFVEDVKPLILNKTNCKAMGNALPRGLGGKTDHAESKKGHGVRRAYGCRPGISGKTRRGADHLRGLRESD